MLQFEHPTLIIAAAIVLSLLLALFVYRKDARFKSASTFLKILLVGLRFISLSILALLLFKPKWLNETKEVEKPIIVFLQDASSSILNYPDSTFYKAEFIKLIEENNRNLSAEFELYSYHFSESVKEGISNTYEGKSTDISNAFQNIDDRFHNRNLAAIILASDGNYNKGINPYYQTAELNSPIFTLALGNSTPEPDLLIESVRHNEIAYFQNEFPIQFEILSNFDSEKKHRIHIRNKEKTIYEEFVDLRSQTPLSKQLFIEATEEGIQYYDIAISSFDGEKNIENNQHRIAIEVLNNLQNILILSSAPHPDISALRSALEEGENYQVKSALFHEFKEDIEAYNLIILHQIPDFTRRNQDLLNKIVKSETSLFFIGGKATKWSEFNEIQNLLEIKTKNSMLEVFPIINEDFSPFELSANCKEFIQSAPPLQMPFAEVIKKEPGQSLFKQKIEGIHTNKDLLFFAEKEEKQMAVLLAEGLWKWRLFDYQKNESHDNFNEWIQTLSQYLTLNEDKRKLRLQYPKMITEGDAFRMDAQLYNDNYRLIKEAELRLLLQDEDGTEFVYSLTPNGSTYKTIIKNLNEGTYQFKVESKFKNEQTEQTGTFAILASTLEQQKQEANWNILKKISNNTGGLFIEKDNFVTYSDIVEKNVERNHQVYFNKHLSDLIKQKSIFLVLLLCLLLEWSIRKRLGTH